MLPALALAAAVCAAALGGEEGGDGKAGAGRKEGEPGYITELVFLGRMEEAGRLSAGMLERQGDDPEGANGGDLYFYVQGLVGSGKLEEADRFSAEAAKRYPDAPMVRVTRLSVLRALGREKEVYDETGWFFNFYNRKLCGKKDADPVALSCVAEAVQHENTDSAKQAFGILTKVVNEGRPEFMPARYWLAGLATERYHWEYAAKALDDLLKQDPGHTYARLMRAELLIARGRYDAAESDVEEVIKRAEGTAEAYAIRAEIAYAEEDMEALAADVGRALERNPLSLRALALKAAMATEEGKGYAREEELAARYGKRQAEFYHMLAKAVARRRRLQEALDLERKAIRVDARYQPAYYEAGVSLLRQGEEKKSYEVLKQSYKLNPFNLWAYNMLQMLDRRFVADEMADVEGGAFVIRLPKEEAAVYGPLMKRLCEEMIPEYEGKYKVKLKGPAELNGRLLLAVMPDHDDFSVRSVGTPNLGALGVCFGQTVTIPSPRDYRARMGEVNWRVVMRHETSHAYTLQLSDYRVPRWLTEGMAMHDEGLPEYEWDKMLAYARHGGEDISLTALNRYFGRPEGRRDVELAYAVSYFATWWIMRKWGEDVPYKMTVAYGKHGIGAHEEVMKEVVGISVEEFEKGLKEELEKYVDREVPLLPPVSEKMLDEAAERLKGKATDLEALTTLVRGLYANGDVEKADALLEKALEAHPGDPVLAAMRAQRHLDEKDPEAAAKLLAGSVKKAEKARFWNLFLAGIAEYQAGRPRKAAKLLEAAERKCPHCIGDANPARASLRLVLAKALAADGKEKEAIEALKREMAHTNTSLEAAKYLEELARGRGDVAARLTGLDRIADVDPFDGGARLRRSEALLAAERREEAFEEARAASVLEEDSPRSLAAMVHAGAAMGKAIPKETAEAALSAYRRLAATAPADRALEDHRKDLETFKERANGE
ncbi:MAG: hypothetical protein JW909_09085 [Planctomycetes bacterium]|nr:hypothetical protein [Planctomycetota bacterium]